MIFGFNTDVKHGNTVYHVQSEARQQDLLLQTQVFVRGRCIGKCAWSFADKVSQPGFSDEQMHELLKARHRAVLDAVKAGKVEELLAQNIIQDVDGQGLAVQWTNSDAPATQDSATLKLLVTDGAAAVPGAQVSSRLADGAESQAVTAADGTAEITVPLQEGETSVLVQARNAGKSATRKFRIRKADAAGQ